MHKSYLDFMREITKEELYSGLLAYGMFTEKLPPIFTAESFFNYCQQNQHKDDKSHQLILYENMREINIPRHFAIPNPFAYQRLCSCIRDNWKDILTYFENKTAENRYKVSRVHIRKIPKKDNLFTMDYDLVENEEIFQDVLFKVNYTNWRLDGTPETDILLGKRWVVKTDISNCFPSMYTHAIAWALAGKETAKHYRSDSCWYNKIDKLSRNIKYGETNGISYRSAHIKPAVRIYIGGY